MKKILKAAVVAGGIAGGARMNRIASMAATAAASLALAGASLLSATNAAADASTPHERAFIYTLDERGVAYPTEDFAINVGHSVCTFMDSGYSLTSIATMIMNASHINGSHVSEENAWYLMGAAIAVFCPEHRHT